MLEDPLVRGLRDTSSATTKRIEALEKNQKHLASALQQQTETMQQIVDILARLSGAHTKENLQ